MGLIFKGWADKVRLENIARKAAADSARKKIGGGEQPHKIPRGEWSREELKSPGDKPKAKESPTWQRGSSFIAEAMGKVKQRQAELAKAKESPKQENSSRATEPTKATPTPVKVGASLGSTFSKSIGARRAATSASLGSTFSKSRAALRAATRRRRM